MKLGIIRCMQTEDYCPGSVDFAALRERRKIAEHLQYLLPRLRIVALVALVEYVSALHQRQFYRRGADIDPQRTDGLLLCLFHAKSRLCAGMAGKK